MSASIGESADALRLQGQVIKRIGGAPPPPPHPLLEQDENDISQMTMDELCALVNEADIGYDNLSSIIEDLGIDDEEQHARLYVAVLRMHPPHLEGHKVTWDRLLPAMSDTEIRTLFELESVTKLSQLGDIWSLSSPRTQHLMERALWQMVDPGPEADDNGEFHGLPLEDLCEVVREEKVTIANIDELGLAATKGDMQKLLRAVSLVEQADKIVKADVQRRDMKEKKAVERRRSMSQVHFEQLKRNGSSSSSDSDQQSDPSPTAAQSAPVSSPPPPEETFEEELAGLSLEDLVELVQEENLNREKMHTMGIAKHPKDRQRLLEAIEIVEEAKKSDPEPPKAKPSPAADTKAETESKRSSVRKDSVSGDDSSSQVDDESGFVGRSVGSVIFDRLSPQKAMKRKEAEKRGVKGQYDPLRLMDGSVYWGPMLKPDQIPGKIRKEKRGTCSWEGDLPHGTGIAEYADGSVYEGDWEYGQWHGHGWLRSRTAGYSYEGPFERDQPHGDEAICVWGDGTKYEGQFVRGIPNGTGTYVFGTKYGAGHRGDKYTGPIKDSEPHGNGVYTFANGDVLECTFKKGKAHGKGKLACADGGSFEGDYKGGSKAKGLYVYPNGNKYKGEYKDDQRHGTGEMTFCSSASYVGKWANDMPDGRGTYFDMVGSQMDLKFSGGFTQHRGNRYRLTAEGDLEPAP